MAGGTFQAKNKIQPGVYINRKSQKRQAVNQAESGVVLYCFDNDWGERNTIIEITSLEDCWTKLGYRYSDEKMRPFVQMFLGTNRTKGANKVKVFIPNVATQTKAEGSIGSGNDQLTGRATCYGKRGNQISFSITPDLNTEIETDVYAVYTVRTFLDGSLEYTQTVGSYIDSTHYTPATIGDLKNNRLIEWSGLATGSLTSTAGVVLTGGDNSAMTEGEYVTMFDKAEKIYFTALCYDGTSATLKSAITTFIERQCENRGIYCQAVMSDYNVADYEGIISIKNGLKLKDGFLLTSEKATWWYSGATAGAKYNESLTHAQHPDAVGIIGEYSNQELDDLIRDGHIVFFEEFNAFMVLDDINTFRTYTETKNEMYSSNRSLRVINDISNYCLMKYDIYFVGQLDTNESGRNILKGDILNYMYTLEANNGLQNVEKEDVIIEPNADRKKAVDMYIAIETVDSIEKIYIQITAS